MPLSNEQVTVGMMKEMLENSGASDDDMLYINGEYGKMGIYSLRRYVPTNEEGEAETPFVVING